MQIKKFSIGYVPAILWGSDSDKLYIHVHGKMSCKEYAKNFVEIAELKAKTSRLDELNILLNMDKRENEVVDGDSPDTDDTPNKKEKDYER